MRTAVERDGASEHIRICGKMFFPEVVADNDLKTARSAAALFIVADKSAADLWLDAEHIEKLRADFCAINAGRAFFTRERKRAIAINRAARQSAILVTEIEEVRIGKRTQVGL